MPRFRMFQLAAITVFSYAHDAMRATHRTMNVAMDPKVWLLLIDHLHQPTAGICQELDEHSRC